MEGGSGPHPPESQAGEQRGSGCETGHGESADDPSPSPPSGFFRETRPASERGFDGDSAPDADSGQPVSKNALKKAAKLQRLEQFRLRRRELRKVKKQHAKLAREERKRAQPPGTAAVPGRPKQLSPEEEALYGRAARKKLLLNRLAASAPTILVDCDFPVKMQSEKELSSLAQQLMFSYGAVKRSSCPTRLVFAGVKPPVLAHLNKISGRENWACAVLETPTKVAVDAFLNGQLDVFNFEDSGTGSEGAEAAGGINRILRSEPLENLQAFTDLGTAGDLSSPGAAAAAGPAAAAGSAAAAGAAAAAAGADPGAGGTAGGADASESGHDGSSYSSKDAEAFGCGERSDVAPEASVSSQSAANAGIAKAGSRASTEVSEAPAGKPVLPLPAAPTRQGEIPSAEPVTGVSPKCVAVSGDGKETRSPVVAQGSSLGAVSPHPEDAPRRQEPESVTAARDHCGGSFRPTANGAAAAAVAASCARPGGCRRCVYLTADSETELSTDDLTPETLLVIGGIVDRNRYKFLTLDRARDWGLETARLAIGGDDGFRKKHLTVNQVVEVILRQLETRTPRMKVAEPGIDATSGDPAREGGGASVDVAVCNADSSAVLECGFHLCPTAATV